MKIFFYIFFSLKLISSLSFAADNFSASELEFIKELPLTFIDIKPEEVLFVDQNMFVTLFNDDKENYLVTAPLRPCIGIVFKHERGVSIFHLETLTSLAYIPGMIKTLNLSNTKAVEISLYTCSLEDPGSLEIDKFKNANLIDKTLNHQEVVTIWVKEFIEKSAKLADIKLEIKNIYFYDPPKKMYNLAFLVTINDAINTIAVNKSGEIFNTSCMKNEILPLGKKFPDFNNLAMKVKIQKLQTYFDSRNLEIFREAGYVNEAKKLTEIGYKAQPILNHKQEQFPYISTSKLCESEDCFKSGKHYCTACKKAFYCSKECQRKAWDKHKSACKKKEL